MNGNKDLEPDDAPVLPSLVKPTDPITSCDFLVQIAADEDVYFEIYDERGRQVTRECVGSRPGPIGTIHPKMSTATRYYEANVCLCGIRDGSMIRFVICTVSFPGYCISVTRRVNHNGNCPACFATVSVKIDDVVDEMRAAVTQRVVEELRVAVEKISGGAKKPNPTPAAEELAPNRTSKPRRGRRRRK